jgi:acyl-CoA reductase-like NAD-dependent aldehyde dehydrogenase
VLQVSQEQFDKIMGLIDKGVQEGAKLETGGKRHGDTCLRSDIRRIVIINSHVCDQGEAMPRP